MVENVLRNKGADKWSESELIIKLKLGEMAFIHGFMFLLFEL